MKFQTLIFTAFLTLSGVLLSSSCAAQEQLNSSSEATQNESKASTEDGQCSKYGPDSLATLDAASIFYYDYAAQGDPVQMAKGRKHYLYVWLNAPGYDRAFIASGLPLYRYLADQAESPELKQAYVDTLFAIYQTLIRCYDRDGYYYGRMGYDMMKYTPKDLNAIEEAFEKSIQLIGNQTEYFVLYP